jgi:acetoacetyl-CoA synthetase
MYPRPSFFVGAKLNFAENLLFPCCDPPEDSLAVIAATEVSREEVTWKELRERVRICTVALRTIGVKDGDRVAGYVSNDTNALVAMLAATSIGAIWSAVSPDTGAYAFLDRVRQIEPTVLFSDNAVLHNGKTHDVRAKLQEITSELLELSAVVIFDTIPDHPFELSDIKISRGRAWKYADFISSVNPSTPQEFTQLEPDHPVYILYSSGTTGKPKCIVHGAIGTLIQHKKEHSIQCSIQPGDRLFYYTTTSWMMWAWLVSGLATGATIILYAGSPFRPLGPTGTGSFAMPNLIESLRITHFGTSAKYLSVLEQQEVQPKPTLGLASLKAIYSTGSPLAPSTFEYVYRAFGPDLNLASITGGTDIISLFGGPSQLSPVYAGEIQALGLGMAVEAWDFAGRNVSATGEPGDLVCVRPFPSQPVAFWGRDGPAAYYQSYFAAFPGVWAHGDFVRINGATGGLVMLGRSDGVLKPAGVRFGSAEIYNVLLRHFGAEVDDALCVGRRRPSDADETVVLFVKMGPGRPFGPELAARIRAVVRAELSPRHVPAVVDECPEIPVTTTGKKWVCSRWRGDVLTCVPGSKALSSRSCPTSPSGRRRRWRIRSAWTGTGRGISRIEERTHSAVSIVCSERTANLT